MNFDLETAIEAVAAIAAEHAVAVDRDAAFPTHTVNAAREHGLLGLTSSAAVGGRGGTMRDAGRVIERSAAIDFSPAKWW